jgi:hypothetical protein
MSSFEAYYDEFVERHVCLARWPLPLWGVRRCKHFHQQSVSRHPDAPMDVKLQQLAPASRRTPSSRTNDHAPLSWVVNHFELPKQSLGVRVNPSASAPVVTQSVTHPAAHNLRITSPQRPRGRRGPGPRRGAGAIRRRPPLFAGLAARLRLIRAADGGPDQGLRGSAWSLWVAIGCDWST